MEKTIVFNSSNQKEKINLNIERPYLKITRIEIPSIPVNSRNIGGESPEFVLKYKSFNHKGKWSEDGIYGILKYITPHHREAVFDVEEVLVDTPDKKSIEFEFTPDDNKDVDVVIHYTFFDEKVALANPFKQFEFEIKQVDNVKILFSAPFGQGKTTFLNHFFTVNKREYEVFKLYPVNYAVAHNEDIFRYIKAELLFQLLGKNIEFDKEKFTYLATAPRYFIANAHNILSPLITFLPKVGKSASEIYMKIYKMASEYLDYHDTLQIDDEAKAIHFIKELYEKEGSVFEDNFYTQLVRQLLEQHKEKTKKQNVLLIDDIDRMDPDHVFRIFNVFSAHFDHPDYNLGLTNKFGFDKIILVCDHQNIRNIYKHIYGNSTAFEGYISKYYSKLPFHYDNTKAIESIAKELSLINGKKYNSVIGHVLDLVISDLVCVQEITLRDLLKLQNLNFYKNIDCNMDVRYRRLNVNRSQLLYFNIISFLNTVYDIEVIKEKLNVCLLYAPQRNNVLYTDLTLIGFVPLLSSITRAATGQHIHKGKSIALNIELISEREINYSYYSARLSAQEHLNFTSKDFYSTFIGNIDKYIEFEEYQD